MRTSKPCGAHLSDIANLYNFTSLEDISLMKARLAEPGIVTRKGKTVSVIIPIKDYEELLERAEDAKDVAWLRQQRRKPPQYRPLQDYLAERKRR